MSGLQPGKQADWRTSRLEGAKSKITCTHAMSHSVMRLRAACIGIEGRLAVVSASINI